MKVRDVMHPGGALIAPETPLSQIAAMTHESGVVPIGEFDRLVGIVTEREISSYAVRDMPKFVSLKDIKANPKLSQMALVTSMRLSVQPVTDEEWLEVCRMGELDNPPV